ncbi:Polyketide cyclase / dehydrase and lipid transport [Aquimarina amphilecti]|uniref:Polyketide cyclase / dehydrase and lipid transport n=1 Tax=Aquimarina amphilecti TaxID=1038014 RepID=A0A1H7J6T5_AQUAM|nr:SRPBCC family protein [Aquimarina amphilecti]SEK70451.1 Polyketide cyclase / dehydrase and lipid transport [Aquimarina amphilecti]
MKLTRILCLVMLAGLGSIQLNAQKSNANVTLTKLVDTSADNVWNKLRQLDDIDKYSSVIAKVKWTGEKGIGGQRICTSADGQGYFKESIIGFDDQNRTYTYALIEGVPAKGMVNNFKVIDLGYQKSMIVWTSSYEKFMKNPQMNEEQFLGFLNQSAGEMINNVAIAAAK